MEEVFKEGKDVKGSKQVKLDMDSFLTFEEFKNSYRARTFSETIRAMERDITGRNNAKQPKKEDFKLRI